MTEEKIDIVVLWVDGSDPEFIREKQEVTGQISVSNELVDGDLRYREFGIFNYWFRMIEKHASWVNNVYLVTNGQKPDWLNLEHPKLRWITHKEFMPEEYYLPIILLLLSLIFIVLKDCRKIICISMMMCT